jgi:magnesium transporter
MQTETAATDLDSPVSAHMRTDFAKVDVRQTVQEALDTIRSQSPPSRIIYFYVVDESGRLCGVIPTRRLLLGGADARIADVMVPDVITLPTTATVLDACELFILHRLLAIPVVDDDRRIVGVVDVELYTEELADLDRSERNDDLFQLIGVHVAEAQRATAYGAFRERFPWLLCNIGGGVLAAFLSGIFSGELQRVVALALFIPVVLALAESVSIQSLTIALSLLHGPRPTLASLAGKLKRELFTGVYLGGASGLLVALVAVVWLGHAPLALCLVIGIAGGVTAASLIGVAMPTLLRMLKRDPEVAAGPIALATTDMATLLIYLNAARWLL